MKVTPTVPTLQSSEEAFQSIKPTRVLVQTTVLNAIRAASTWGRTCDELEINLKLSHQTASARVHDLMKAKLIVAQVDVRRMTRSGRKATVWVTPENVVL